MSDFIDIELKNFISLIQKGRGWGEELNRFLPLSIKHNVKYRCLGRIWDGVLKVCPENYDKWNINRQCKNQVFEDDLCRSCFNRKHSSGLVTEYPHERIVLNDYRKGLLKLQENFKNVINKNNYSEEEYKKMSSIMTRNIDKEIDLNKYERYLTNIN